MFSTIFACIFLVAIPIAFFIYYNYINKKRNEDRKWIWSFVLATIVSGYLIFQEIRRYNISSSFLHSRINSTVVEYHEWRPDQYEFSLKNNMKFLSGRSMFNLEIGDSIVKQKNTSIFYVFKRDYNAKYTFYKKYDYNNEPIEPQR